MMRRRKPLNAPSMAECVADYIDQRDEQVMQALLAAGIFVASADGRVMQIERDELLDFVDRQGFTPTTSRREMSEALDSLMRQLPAGGLLKITAESLRPLVVRTPARVAAADRELHPSEIEAIQMIRQIPLRSGSAVSVVEGALGALVGSASQGCFDEVFWNFPGPGQARQRPEADRPD